MGNAPGWRITGWSMMPLPGGSTPSFMVLVPQANTWETAR